MAPGMPIAATASIQPHQARARGKIPIAPAAPRHTPPAISCLGAFRPPAALPRGSAVIPAAENLHTKRREQVQRQLCQCAGTSRQKMHQAKAKPCAARFRQMSNNRSSVVNLSRRIALAPRTIAPITAAWRAHRGGLGQVQQRRAATSRSTISSASVRLQRLQAGLPKRRAVDTLILTTRLWLGPSWPRMFFGQIYSIHFERGPPCQKS